MGREKIFEKILYSRIYSSLCNKNILSETQFGFRKDHSTNHAIEYSVDFINKSHLKQKHVLGIFIDLSKAFGTIDHKLLMHKLYNYGIHGTAHDLLHSYVNNRYQCVKIESEISVELLVKYGVAQGSVLGPLLFLLYINDLKNVIGQSNCRIIMYGDDTNIFIAYDTIDDVTTLANTYLDKVESYIAIWLPICYILI